MASLLALLAQQTPNLQTRKGLILLGLQNDFLSPEGKLPVSTKTGFLDRLKKLVPAFRDYGDVIWVRSEFEANRDVNPLDHNGDTVIAGPISSDGDKDRSISSSSKRSAPQGSVTRTKRTKSNDAEHDEELFLTKTPTREPCCVRGSQGADYPDDIKLLVDETKDIQVVKTYYSAFSSTSLLLTLRSRLITELFVCGCNTNLSVFATAMDAARYGIKITLIEDCLGFRQRERHDEAIRQLVQIMASKVVNSDRVIDVLENPPEEEEQDVDDDDDDYDSESEEEDLKVYAGDTATQAPNLLEVDSESEEDKDEEDQLAMSKVCLPVRGVPSRYQPASSRWVSVETSRPPHRKHAQPQDTRPPQSKRFAVKDRGTQQSDESRADSTQPRKTSDDRGVIQSNAKSHTTQKGHASLAVNDSSSEIIIDSRISAQNSGCHASTKSPPRCTHPGLAALSTLAGLNQQTVNEYQQAMEQARHEDNPPLRNQTAPHTRPLFGEDKVEESAGSSILYDLLPSELAEGIFDQLKDEVTWQRMHHQTGDVPRLVCCQGDIDADGSMPVYRHPSDQTIPLQAWTSTVRKVRDDVQKVVGHPLNHVLIQLYRGGTDYISEHSDKTLDICPGSSIVNVSFGAQRTMRLRTKRAVVNSPASSDQSPQAAARTTYRVPLPHNSMITMSLATNAEYLHGINADKRPSIEFNEAEKAYGHERISLTFRHIGTFLSQDEKRIWGQGATSKTKAQAKHVINGNESESEKLVRAFGKENQASTIDWDAVYEGGSDVLHLKSR